MGYRSLTTARLRLTAVVPEDLDEHFGLLSDPLVGEHRPSGRHTTPTHTGEGIERQLSSWEQAGLGYWTARLRDDVAAGVEGVLPGGPNRAAAPDSARAKRLCRSVDRALT